MSEDKSKDDKAQAEAQAERAGPDTTPDGTPVVRTIGRDFRVEGNDVDGYIGVSDEYRTYSNESDKPYITDGDVDALTRSGQLTDVEQMTGNVAEQKVRDAIVRGDFDDDAEAEAEASSEERPLVSVNTEPPAEEPVAEEPAPKEADTKSTSTSTKAPAAKAAAPKSTSGQ